MGKKGRRSRKAKQGQKQRGNGSFGKRKGVGRVTKSMLRGRHDSNPAQPAKDEAKDPLANNRWAQEWSRPMGDIMRDGLASGAAVIHSEGAYMPLRLNPDDIPDIIKEGGDKGAELGIHTPDPDSMESFLRSIGPDGFPTTKVAGMKLRARDANSTLGAMMLGLGHYSAQKQRLLDNEIAQAVKGLEGNDSEEGKKRYQDLKEWLFSGKCNMLGRTGAATNCGFEEHKGSVDQFIENLGTLGLANRANDRQSKKDSAGGVPPSDPGNFGTSYKIDLGGTSFAKVNPDLLGPRFDNLTVTPSDAPLAQGGDRYSASNPLAPDLEDWGNEFSIQQLRPVPYRAPDQFSGYDTFINILNHRPEQIAPPDHTIHHLLAQAERFVYIQPPEEFLPEAFDGERYTPAYLECMAEAKEREAGGFYMPFEVCCFEDSSSFMAIVGGGNRRGLYDFRYFVDIQPVCPILITPSYNSNMLDYLNRKNTKIAEHPTKGDAVVRVGMAGNIGQFVGGKLCTNIILFREFVVSRKGRVIVDYQNATARLFNVEREYDKTAVAMANNVLTTIEEIMYLNNQGVTPTQYQRCTSTPVDAPPPRNSKKGRKKRAYKKRSTTIMIEPGKFERSAKSLGGGGEGSAKLRKYHHRRGCEVTLSHARFARSGKQGKTIWRRPCWVGETEGIITDLCPTLKGDRLYVIDTKGRPDHKLEEE